MSDIFDKFRLDGKTALVTGGAGLLGRQFSRTLAQAGAHVLAADVDGDGKADPVVVRADGVWLAWLSTRNYARIEVTLGAGAGALLAPHGSELGGAAIGGLVGGAAEVVAGSLTQVVWYAVITDLQISERAQGAVSEEFSSDLKQGTGATYTKQRSARAVKFKKYQTRIASSARKVGLEWPEAYPHLRQGLVNAISGMF